MSSVNQQVIARLGLLDSRVHLVCMSEALRGNSKEMDKFRYQPPPTTPLQQQAGGRAGAIAHVHGWMCAAVASSGPRSRLWPS